MTAKLHVLRETNLHDVPATLRRIADEIEAGAHGKVNACAVTLDATNVEIFYMGTGEAAPNAVLLFNVAVAKITNRVLEAKGG